MTVDSILQQFRQVNSTWFEIEPSALLPMTTGNDERVDISLFPPLPFFACGVDLTVVDGAKRNSEFIADL
jgi:hypothetical protein